MTHRMQLPEQAGTIRVGLFRSLIDVLLVSGSARKERLGLKKVFEADRQLANTLTRGVIDRI